MTTAHAVRDRLRRSGFTIYDDLTAYPELVYTVPQLEGLLSEHLCGKRYAFPIRTRKKLVNVAICEALGYPSPDGFRKTRPRFPGQNLEPSVQKADNLQIWNAQVSPSTRYALIRVDADSVVTAVKVTTGDVVANWDRTGTLTSKYQAARSEAKVGSILVSNADTANFVAVLAPCAELPAGVLAAQSPEQPASRGAVLTIDALYRLLLPLVGSSVPYVGADQERNRGTGLQRAVVSALGLRRHADHGQFPDIACQALEVKLQTAQTVDLGLVTPDSLEPAELAAPGLRHCDVRYALFYARPSDGAVTVDALVLTSGEAFFKEFRRFGGLVQNRKLQIRIPPGFFT